MTADISSTMLPSTFHQAVHQWFEKAFAKPTPVQSAAWAEINSGQRVLIAAPTGSGKTTTLYSALSEINSREQNIITVEDPIEMVYDDFNKTAIDVKVGITYAAALRHILRHDPDVIMVGEMRDLETMATAITAAETGHLVFATLHTTGAARTVDRIVDAFPTNQQEQIRTQLASSLVSVISQLLLVRQDRPGRMARPGIDARLIPGVSVV